MVLVGLTEDLLFFLWEDESSEHIQQWIQTYSDDSNLDPPMEQLRVQANIVTQSLVYVTQSNNVNDNSNTPTLNENPPVVAAITGRAPPDKKEDDKEGAEDPKPKNTRRRRVRQARTRRTQVVTSTTAQALEIVFEIAVSYRSQDTNEIDLLQLILQAFQSGEGRKQYSKRLQDSKDPTFANLSDFVLQVQDDPNGLAAPDGGDGGGENKIIVWTLVGAAVVAVAVSISLFVLYLRRVDSGRQKLEDSTTSNPNPAEQAIFEPASSADPSGGVVSRLSK